jgi:hypothetical protein
MTPNQTIKKGISYFGNRHLNHFRKDLSEIKSFSFNYIIHTFSENDLRYFGKTLRDFVQLSKDEGLEVYIDPWGVGKIFGGEAFSEFVAKYPQECQVLNSGERVAAACPNRKAFKNFMFEWVDKACELGGDVIFWDEPHYYLNSTLAIQHPLTYKKWACRCTVCLEKFKMQFGYEMGNGLTQDVFQFRQTCLLDFLKSLSGRVHDHGLRNAACLIPVPLPKVSRILGIEDWRFLANLKEIDILSTDPYWSLLGVSVEKFVGSFSKTIVDLATEFGKESEVWIQAFKIPKEREKEVLEAIQIASSFKPSRMAVWSYQATACMSELACENSERVWEIIRAGFKSI